MNGADNNSLVITPVATNNNEKQSNNGDHYSVDVGSSQATPQTNNLQPRQSFATQRRKKKQYVG